MYARKILSWPCFFQPTISTTCLQVYRAGWHGTDVAVKKLRSQGAHKVEDRPLWRGGSRKTYNYGWSTGAPRPNVPPSPEIAGVPYDQGLLTSGFR